MRRHRQGCLAAAVVLVAAQAPGQGHAESGFLASNLALAESHVIPRYAALAEATGQLDEAATAFCTTPSAAGLDATRAGYQAAMDAWMGVAHIHFGPVEFLMRGFRIAFWPDKHNTGSKQLAKLLAAEDDAALAPAAFARGSVAVQGLPALEKLLYGGPDSLGPQGEPAYRCKLAVAITDNLAGIAEDLLREWRDGEDSTLSAIRTAAGGEGLFENDEAVAALFFKSLNQGLVLIAEVKLARPLGSSLKKAKPRRSESWRSARSMQNVVLNLQALEALYGAEGALASLLTEDPAHQALDAEIRQGFRKAIGLAKSLGLPLSAAVKDEAARLIVEDLKRRVEAQRERIAGPLAQALGLAVGFNTLDGD